MDPLLAGLIIFTLRIVDVTMMILRILMVIRGRKALAWLFGFIQALVFTLLSTIYFYMMLPHDEHH